MTTGYPNSSTNLGVTPFGANTNVVVDKGFAMRGEFCPVPNTESLAGNKTIAQGDPFLHFFTPTAARNVTMPATSLVATYLVCNMSATYALTVKDASATTIVVVQPSSAAFVISDGTTWKGIGMNAATTAALITFTQTYSTPTSTVAAPTAAALTVTDGTGTNDGTIGAITDNASTIAAVQELAAMIAKLVADDLNNRQVLTRIIDILQANGLAA